LFASRVPRTIACVAGIPAEVATGLCYVTVCVGWLELFENVVEPGVRRALGQRLGVRVIWQRQSAATRANTTWAAEGPASARASSAVPPT